MTKKAEKKSKEKAKKKPAKKEAKPSEKKGLRARLSRKKTEAKPAKEEKKAVKKEVKVEKKETVKESKKVARASTKELLRDYEIIIHPLISEKAVNAIEAENQLTFVVNKNASKVDVRKAVESMFEVKVDNVRVMRDMKGRKKAMVKINKEFKADDIATKMGVL